MKQTILGGSNNSLSTVNSAVEYNSLMGGSTWDSGGNPVDRYQIITTPGTLKDLRVKVSAAPGGVGDQWDFAVYINGSATALNLSIVADAISNTDASEVIVSAGDLVCMRCTVNTDGGMPTSYASWSLDFEGDNAKESLIMNGFDDWTAVNATEYTAIAGGTRSWSANAAGQTYAKCIMPCAGTIKNFYIRSSHTPGVGENVEFAIYKNTSKTALVVQIDHGEQASVQSNTFDEIAFVAGDQITLGYTSSSGAAVSNKQNWGVTLEATTDGEFVIFGGTTNNILANGTTEYNYLTNVRNGVWNASETNFRIPSVCNAMTLTALYVAVNVDPGVGNSWVYTVRDTGSDTSLQATVSGGTTGNDTAESVAIDVNDELTISVVGVSSPTVGNGDSMWGICGYHASSEEFVKELTDEITLVGSILKNTRKNITEILNLDSVLEKVWTIQRALTDNITPLDIYAKISTNKRILSDVIYTGSHAINECESLEDWSGGTLTLSSDAKLGKSLHVARTGVSDATWYETGYAFPEPLSTPFAGYVERAVKGKGGISFWFKCSQPSTHFNGSSYVRLREPGSGDRFGWRISGGDWTWSADTWTYITLNFADSTFGTGAPIELLNITLKSPDADSVDFTFQVDNVKIFGIDIVEKVWTIKKEAVENSSLIDNIDKQSNTLKTETITATDTIERVSGFYREFLDTVNLSAVLLRDTDRLRDMFETITLVDSVERLTALYRVFIEVSALVDTTQKLPTMVNSEDISLTDTVITLTEFGRILNEIVNITDTKFIDVIKVLIDTLNLTDTYAKIWTILRTPTETTTLSDIMNSSPVKNVSETIGLADSILKDARKNLVETLNLTDIFERAWTLARTYAEIIELVDIVTAIKVTVVNLIETITLIDSYVDVLGFIRTLSEVITPVDIIIKNIVTQFIESITLGNLINKFITKAPFTESVTLIGNMLRDTVNQLTETITLSDSIIKNTFKNLIESLGANDNLTKDITKPLTDSMTLIDTFTKIIELKRILSDTIVMSALLLRDADWIKDMAEYMTLTDTVEKIFTSYRELIESVTLADSIVQKIAKNLTETATLIDTIVKDTIIEFNEIIILTVSYIQIITKIFTDTVTLTESLIKSFITTKILLETINLTDIMIRLRVLEFLETIKLTDFIFGIGAHVQQIVLDAMVDKIVIDDFIHGIILDGMITKIIVDGFKNRMELDPVPDKIKL